MYSDQTTKADAPSKLVVGIVACATTVVVAALTYSVTAPQTVMYSAPAVRTVGQVAPLAFNAEQKAPVVAEATLSTVEGNNAPLEAFASAQPASKALLVTSFSSLMLAIMSAFAAAYGYRSQALAMASSGGSRTAPKGSPARGGQAGAGYKGSTQPGSAPPTRQGKPGYVYKLGLKNGRGNVDEYSPIYDPNDWKADGDVYEPGFTGIALWAAGFLALLGASAFLIYSTSQL
jgi:photosystem II protein